jgi:hypothetical protein
LFESVARTAETKNGHEAHSVVRRFPSSSSAVRVLRNFICAIVHDRENQKAIILTALSTTACPNQLVAE